MSGLQQLPCICPIYFFSRFKSLHTSTSGRKLVSARASPQLGPIVPILNQIHEESEEGGNSPEVSFKIISTGESFPKWIERKAFIEKHPSHLSLVQVDRAKQGSVVGLGAPAGAAVLRRLEQRRRLHKVGGAFASLFCFCRPGNLAWWK